MTLDAAIDLIRPAVDPKSKIWADIGAGTGMFTIALMDILESGTIYAFDKNPHALWDLKSGPSVEIAVREGDFTMKIDLPQLDGVIMANALHYAKDHSATLENVLSCLKTGATFILVEYETHRPNPPWVPYPVSFEQFRTIAGRAGLSDIHLLGKVESVYGHDHIYACSALKNQ